MHIVKRRELLTVEITIKDGFFLILLQFNSHRPSGNAGVDLE